MQVGRCARTNGSEIGAFAMRRWLTGEDAAPTPARADVRAREARLRELASKTAAMRQQLANVERERERVVLAATTAAHAGRKDEARKHLQARHVLDKKAVVLGDFVRQLEEQRAAIDIVALSANVASSVADGAALMAAVRGNVDVDAVRESVADMRLGVREADGLARELTRPLLPRASLAGAPVREAEAAGDDERAALDAEIDALLAAAASPTALGANVDDVAVDLGVAPAAVHVAPLAGPATPAASTTPLRDLERELGLL